MATYVTASDFTEYVEGVLAAHEVPAGAALERLLLAAERDVDRAIGGPPNPYTDRRLDVALLTQPQQDAVARATCAAAEFRIRQGEARLVGSDDGVEIAGSLKLARVSTLPRRSPKMIDELRGYGLLLHSGTVPVTDAGA